MPEKLSLIKIFRNKYIITLTAFIILMLFVDHNDIFVQFNRKKQLNDLFISKAYYQKQIDQTKKNLSDLQTSAAALEKYAREKYLLKRDNEDVFLVATSPEEKSLKSGQ